MEQARLVVDGRDVAGVEIARSMADRSRGLLGREGLAGALWLQPCRSVHTLRMRFAIDVAHVAGDGTVLAVATMAPWRFGAFRWRSRAVVEAAAGRFGSWGVRQGSRLTTRPGSDPERSR